MPTFPCFTSIFREILQGTTIAYHATTGHHRSAFFPVLKQKRLSILQAVRAVANLCLQKPTEHPSHICSIPRTRGPPLIHCSPMLHRQHLHPTETDQDLSPVCTFPREARTVCLECAEPEKGRANRGKTDPPIEGRGRPGKVKTATPLLARLFSSGCYGQDIHLFHDLTEPQSQPCLRMTSRGAFQPHPPQDSACCCHFKGSLAQKKI